MKNKIAKIVAVALAVMLVIIMAVQFRNIQETNERYDRMQIILSESGMRTDWVTKELAPMICFHDSTNIASLKEIQNLAKATMEKTGFPPFGEIVRVREGFVGLKGERYILLGPDYVPPHGYHLAQYGRHTPVFSMHITL